LRAGGLAALESLASQLEPLSTETKTRIADALEVLAQT
jgi:hypothetical protein